MPRQAKPFYRKANDSWYVNVTESGRRRQILLVEGKANYDTARKRFHAIMATREGSGPHIQPASGSKSLAAVLDRFLTFVKRNRAEATSAWHAHYLNDLMASVSEDPLTAGLALGELPVTQLKVHHITEWIDSHDGWGDSSKSAAARSVRTAFNWAKEQEVIAYHTICNLKAMATPARDTVLDKADFEALVAAVKDPDFKDLLIFSKNTGSRPQEACIIEAAHCQLGEKLSRIVIPPSEAKRKTGKRRPPRVIYLNDVATEIVTRLVKIRPTGKLFRNKRGPWNRNKIRCKFKRMEKTLGKLYCMNNLRHTWVTDLLVNNVDSMIVGVLADHANPATVGKTYQHVAVRPEFLQAAANKGGE